MSPAVTQWKPSHPAFRALLNAFLQQTSPIYVVGGVVRDFLLGKSNPQTDLDLVIEQAALPTARRIADQLGWSFYPLDPARDVARLVFPITNSEPLVCDTASLRGDSIEADLWSRDFTVNAMALALEANGSIHLIDTWNGQRDLVNLQIRRVSAASLAEDPVRLLRAVRFMHQLGFTLEEETFVQIKRLSSTLRLASLERLRDELWKMLATDKPAQAIDDLRQLGLLGYVLPEVAALVDVEQSYPHYQDVYRHTLQTVEYAVQLRNWVQGRPLPNPQPATLAWQQALEGWRVRLRYHFANPLAAGHPRIDWLVWHALLHDIGKPVTRTAESQPGGAIRYRFLEHERVGAELAVQRLTQLRFSRPEIVLTNAVIEGHMRPHLLDAAFVNQPLSRRACYRFLRDVGGKQFEHPAGVDTLLLGLADYQAIYKETPPPNWSGYLAHADQLFAFAFAADGLAETQQKPLVDGHLLMTHLNLKPGRLVGEMLEYLLEAQAANEIKTAEEALTLASSWLHEKSSVTNG
ncbi:MAG: HDIG domain-containing protein [Caldilineaceae bacterium]